jgi:D-2-hydroxyacid dehydrogenase (NADP+)
MGHRGQPVTSGSRYPARMSDTPPPVRGFLIGKRAAQRHAELLERWKQPDDPNIPPLAPILLPEDDDTVLSDEVVATLRAGFLSPDMLPFTPEYPRFLGIIRRAPNVEWLHCGHAGLDAPIFGELMDQGIELTNSPGATSEPIAQSVMAGLLALHRGVLHWVDAQRRHAWERRGIQHPELRSQTIVVLGLGSIGQHVARFAQAFGLHVIGVRRNPAGPADHVDEWAGPDRLHEVLPRADWLAITIPLTSRTRRMIDAEAIALMPRGARILNVARGAIIDEPAMVEALQSGHLGGAYLDVFEVEPLPDESPLWDMPNVLISPHESAASEGNLDRVDQIFDDELNRWMRGEPHGRVVRDR